MDARVDDSDPVVMNDLLLRLMRGVNGQAFSLLGDEVLTGPFKGMVVAERTPYWDDGNSGTKLLGCYEHELHGSVEHAISRRPRTIINVGCGEGYYAIGMARRCLEAEVIALDTEAEARSMCDDYARRNDVHVNLIDGARRPEELRFVGAPEPRLYIVDCEGHELELIDPRRCPELRSADIIVECHDFLWKDLSLVLAGRLVGTHAVIRISPRLPDFSQFPFLQNSPTAISVLVVVEKRPMPCYWLTCWANRGD